MLNITITPYINGFGVKAFDSSTAGYPINEFHEEYSEALKAIRQYILDEELKELHKKVESAGATL